MPQRDPVQFMQRMIESYAGVHNKRYWSEVTPFIEEEAKGNVLDIGCGPGLLLQDIYQKFNSSHLYGIDLSPVMLDKAKEILGQNIQTDQFTLIHQHMQEDPRVPEHLNLVVTSRVMRSFGNIPDIMMSIHSALESSGKLVILDWAQAPIATYASWFQSNNNEFNELSPAEIIAYHRNFSRYSITDWHYILESSNFTPIHSFQLNTVLCCVIAEPKK